MKNDVLVKKAVAWLGKRAQVDLWEGLGEGEVPLGAESVPVEPLDSETSVTLGPGDNVSKAISRTGLGQAWLPRVLEMNNLTEQSAKRLQPGSTIHLPEEWMQYPDAPPKVAPVKPPAPVNYTIRNGDVLGRIAQQFGTSVPALQNLNGITDPNKIQAGKTIRVR